MIPLSFVLPVVAMIAAAPATPQNWQRYSQPTGLSAEIPGQPERFDAWTDIAKGRVIQLNSTMRDGFDFKAFYFLQAVIADNPYDVDKELKQRVAEVSGGDAAASRSLVSQRALKPAEMPLPGMRGVEVVSRIYTFGGDGAQIEYSRNMYVGNKWLSVSVRHFETDNSWQRDRFFKSVTWKP
jgi:hypothetical protein